MLQVACEAVSMCLRVGVCYGVMLLLVCFIEGCSVSGIEYAVSAISAAYTMVFWTELLRLCCDFTVHRHCTVYCR